MTSVASDGAPRSALRRFLLPGLFVAALFWVFFSTIPQELGTVETVPRLSAHLTGQALGTTYNVKVVAAPGKTVDEVAVSELIVRALERVDALMSTWRVDSELSRFNAHPAGAPFPLSDETLEVLQVALQVYTESGGAFDVTVKPLVDLWGFGAAGERPAPSGEDLQAAMAHVGGARLVVDRTAKTAVKTVEGLSVDLSALAKGYAADVVARALRAADYDRYMVEVGGEIVTHGHSAQGRRWQLAIERPMNDDIRAIFSVVSLSGGGMATSGDYRRYRVEDGRRLSHTIDPRLGTPVSHGLASVTVIAKSAVEADAYATALMVLGPDEGHALAERYRIAAFFIERTSDGTFVHSESTAWTVAGYDDAEGAL